MDTLLKMTIKEKTAPFYQTDLGKCYLGDGLELIKSVPDDSVNLVITSPPFALTSKKEYGNKHFSEYNDWFIHFANEFKRVLTPDGSFVVDLGGTYIPGHPVRSIYQYELLIRLVRECGFYLAQEFFHYNPARLPAPAEWVNVRRIRVKDSVNVVWWLSKTEMPKADNRNVLNPYSPAMENLLKNGYKAKMRPSGHNITNKFSKNNAGSIPSNVLELGNNDSNSSYMTNCKLNDIKPHPAKFPRRFAEFFIKFLTNENDTVLDPFAGSNTTGFAAEELRRKWMSFELDREYVKGSVYRFPSLYQTESANNGNTK